MSLKSSPKPNISLSSSQLGHKHQKHQAPLLFFSLKSLTLRCSNLINLEMEQRMLSIPQDQASGAGSTGWLRRKLVPMGFVGRFWQAVQWDGSVSRLVLPKMLL